MVIFFFDCHKKKHWFLILLSQKCSQFEIKPQHWIPLFFQMDWFLRTISGGNFERTANYRINILCIQILTQLNDDRINISFMRARMRWKHFGRLLMYISRSKSCRTSLIELEWINATSPLEWIVKKKIKHRLRNGFKIVN